MMRSIALLSSAIVLAGCTVVTSDALVRESGSGHNGDGTVSLGHVSAGESIVLGLMSLCVEGTDSGTVDSVDAVGDGSIEVTGFAIDNVESGIPPVGAATSTLSDLGYRSNDNLVRVHCSNDGSVNQSQLLVQVVRRTDTTAMVEGFRVHWTADGAHGTFDISFPNWLCDASEVSCGPAR